MFEGSKAEILKKVSSYRGLHEELARTVYLERIRLTQKPWKVDSEDESDFWRRIKDEILSINPSETITEEQSLKDEEILDLILSRYVKEIAGNFRPPTYNFARKAIPVLFSRLLNASLGTNFKAKWSKQFDIRDKVHFIGDIEAIRQLALKHTLVILPTHFSNIDSIVIGWAIQAIGLPAFLYGAGLNLFGIRLFAYFMNRLGAYKVDRRKKNLIYLETLKEYSTRALHNGCHSLFFPGGTRSRSGALEDRLKLGLLGTAFDAQFLNLQQSPVNEAKKIIIVPVVFSYHFVLEAPVLIEQYLKEVGQERYIRENDEFSTSYKISKFLIQFFRATSDMTLSFGPCLDLFGNKVDRSGRSLDSSGREVDIRDYYISNGKLKSDKQRESEYIRLLSAKIVDRFHKDNVVFTSHLIAFTAFQLLLKKFRRLDLYQVLRLPNEDTIIPFEDFFNAVARLRDVLEEMAGNGLIKLSPRVKGDVHKVIEHGLQNLGLYHAARPLVRNKKGDVYSEDMKLLFYYHNRTKGYDLEQHI